MDEIKHSRRLVCESKNLAVGGENLNVLAAVERLIADQEQTGNALEIAIATLLVR